MGYKSCSSLIALMLSFCLLSCHTGYKKIDGEWSYVTWDEGHGRRVHDLAVDNSTFSILKNKAYAKDKDHVFYKGKIIPDADPTSYNLLEREFFAKDKNHVFLFYYKLEGANPETFTELKFPYGRDDKRVFCGTIPMNVHNIDAFKVVKSSKSYNTLGKDIFMESNAPDFDFLDTLQTDMVIHSWDAKAKTDLQHFEDYKEVKVSGR